MKNSPHKNASLALRFASFKPSHNPEFSLGSHKQTKKASKSKISSGFSLIEMLMALLVASLLMAALTPVLVRKPENIANPEVKDKIGEQIWAAPGNYSLRVPNGITGLFVQAAGGGGGGGGLVMKTFATKTYSAVSTQTIDVPKGVYEISFTLIGAGGSGGGGYGAAMSGRTCPYRTISGMSDSGRDLCYFSNGSQLPAAEYGSSLMIYTVGTSSVYNNVCFVGMTNPGTIRTGSRAISDRTVCSQSGANSYCSTYLPIALGWNYSGTSNRLLTPTEMQRIIDLYNSGGTNYLAPDFLDMLVYPSYAGSHPTLSNAHVAKSCIYVGTGSGYCVPDHISLRDAAGDYYFAGTYGLGSVISVKPGMDTAGAGEAKCVYEVEDWKSFAGGGGAAGSKLSHTVKVTPGDQLQITVGGGGAAVNVANGGSAQTGGVSSINHRNSSGALIASYFANGGIGGNNATTTVGGARTSYSPTCSAGGTCSSSSNIDDGNGANGWADYSNYAGHVMRYAGGAGANGAAGGTIDLPIGANASVIGGGGGGGACGRGIKTAASCSKGGTGFRGEVQIAMKGISAGGGGGAGGAVGNDTVKGAEKFLKLKVEAGDIISVTVGQGGAGGGLSTKGQDGKDTIIGVKNDANKIVFKAGLGGSAGSFSGETPVGGSGGAGGSHPNADASTYNLVLPLANALGRVGGSDATGYSGGQGGRSDLGAIGACGGMQRSTDLLCNSSSANGNDAKMHNPSTNLDGAAGGGGGGYDPVSNTVGQGGSGASGYARIKWVGVE